MLCKVIEDIFIKLSEIMRFFLAQYLIFLDIEPVNCCVWF